MGVPYDLNVKIILRMNRITLVFSLLLLLASCKGGFNHTGDTTDNPTKMRNIRIKSPSGTATLVTGEPVQVQYELRDASLIPDSVQLWVDGAYVKTLLGATSGSFDSDKLRVGTITVMLKAFYTNEDSETAQVSVQFISNITPQQVLWKLIKTITHDKKAYTQGLFLENGIMYESAGEYGHSRIIKYSYPALEPQAEVNLDARYFAEGLAIVGDYLYVLTWQEKTCFVYDKKTYQLIKTLPYDYGEGWGLAYDGSELLFSDGSSTIYKLNPENLEQVGKIEVRDNKGPVKYLNELEVINGRIYANVYGSDFLVVIDPITGKVIQKIVLEGLMAKSDYSFDTDVLNGIAYNAQSGNLIVTGKKWPKMFEIKLIE